MSGGGVSANRHEASIVYRPKMDTERLFVAVCSCGYESSRYSSEQAARAVHAMHATAKIAALPDGERQQVQAFRAALTAGQA